MISPLQAYWCAMPNSPTEILEDFHARLAKEASIGCGALASQQTFWLVALGIAGVVAFALSWWLTSRDEWNEWGGLLLVALPVGLFWWITLPLVSLVIPIGAGIAIPRARVSARKRRNESEAREARELAEAEKVLAAERVL